MVSRSLRTSPTAARWVLTRLLATVPGVRDVTLYGTLLHVLVADLSPADLRAALEQDGLQVSSIREIKPSLEDVFVSLTGRHLRDE